MSGLGAVMWKEWRCILTSRNRSQVLLPLAAIAFMPIWSGWEMGTEWLVDPFLPPVLVVATAMILVGILVPDAFAGERERRTLATLLASPLSDRAILFGKIIVPVLVSLAVTIAFLLLSMVVVNVAEPTGGVHTFTPALILGLPALGVLVALFTAAIGVFISLRSSSVQTAQQVLVSVLMTPLMIGGAVFMAFATSGGPAPDWLTSLDLGTALGRICLVLVVIDAVLIAVVDVRFRRSRLIELG